MAGDRTVTTLTAVLQMNNTKFKKGLTSSQKALKGFQDQVRAVGSMVAGAFAVGSLVNFGREAVRVAAKAEGIRIAFARLNQPDLLDNLKAATRGTISEIELMQAAVRAENFKIPLTQLATFFDFATQRAIQTGESVNYLTESIINGIGRKSSLVLDNLGISASELQEEIKKVGDFGQAAANIISREMSKAGTVLDTTATKAAQLRAKFEDLKEDVGTGLIATIFGINEAVTGAFNPAVYTANKAVKDFQEEIRNATLAGQQMMGLFGFLKGPQSVGGGAYQYPSVSSVSAPMPQFAESIFNGWDKISGRGGSSGIVPEIDRMTSAMTKFINDGVVEMMAEIDEEAIPTLNAVTKEMLGFGKATVDVGKSVGVMLVSQFDALGEAIGGALSGAEDSLKNLGKAILQNLGNILIMAGFQMGPAGIPLIIAGAVMQLGGGIIKGLGDRVDAGSVSSYGYASTVKFKIEGRDLVAAMDRNGYYTNANT